MAEKISLENVYAKKKELYDKSNALVEKKGRDYNRKQQKEGDTLFNLRVSTILGVTKTSQQGVMVRLSDKFMRLCSLYDAEELESNKDESFEDVVVDFYNYLAYLVLFREEQRRELAHRCMPKVECPFCIENEIARQTEQDNFVKIYVDEAREAEQSSC